MRRIVAFLILFDLMALIFLEGCGRKAPPVPPGTIRPRAVRDLSGTMTAEGIGLSWSAPTKNTDGSPLTMIKGFQIFKAEIRQEDFCEGCPVSFGPPILIPFAARPEEAGRMLYEDRALREGMRYIYEVRTVKGWLSTSDPSNRVSLSWHVPPSPPGSLAAESLVDGIYLSWEPPSTWTDGRPIQGPLSYRVYREKDEGNDWADISDLIKDTAFLDRRTRQGFRYRYAVSAIHTFHGTEIESPRTEAVDALKRDVTPPAAPRGLVATRDARGVELLWQENPEADLSGYHVYRKDPSGKTIRLTTAPVPLSRYVDPGPFTPGTYEYSVTALDRSSPPNEGPSSGTATVEIP